MIECVQASWQPQIGDASIMGWVTVAAYFFAACLSFMVYHNSYEIFIGYLVQKNRRFWLLLTFVLFFLCINKQLDLQSLLTAVGKCSARENGWYEDRRLFQLTFIFFMSLCMLIGLIWSWFAIGEALKQNWLALVGLFFLATFVLIRASSFHKMDLFINLEIMSVRMNWMMELTGIIAICICSIQNLKNLSTRSH